MLPLAQPGEVRNSGLKRFGVAVGDRTEGRVSGFSGYFVAGGSKGEKCGCEVSVREGKGPA